MCYSVPPGNLRSPNNFDCVEMGKRAKAKRAMKRAVMHAPKKQRFSKAFKAEMPKGRRSRVRHVVTEGIRPIGTGNKGIRRSRMGLPFVIPDRTESLGDVSGSTGFANTNYNINPGLTTSFPWLSILAQAFEYWSVDKIEYSFKSTSGSAIQSASAALGKVVMSTDYDVFDTNFTTTQQAENYEGFTRTETWKDATHVVMGGGRRVGKLPVSEWKIRNGSIPAGADQSLYDLGNFQLITSGQPSAFIIGELFVTYRGLKFYKPKTATPLGQFILAAHYAGTPTSASPGAAMVQRSGSNIVLTTANTSFTIANPGRYLCVFAAFGSTSWTSGGGMSAGANCTGVNVWNNSTHSAYDAGLAATAGEINIAVFDVTAPNGVVNIAAGTLVGTGTSDIYVVQVPSGLSKSRVANDRVDALAKQVRVMMDSLASLGANCSEDEDDYKQVIEPVELNGRVVARLVDRIEGGNPYFMDQRSSSRSSSRDPQNKRA